MNYEHASYCILRRRRRRPSVVRSRTRAQFPSFLPYRYPIIMTKREIAVGIIIEMSRDHVIKLSRKASIRSTTNTVTRNLSSHALALSSRIH